MSVIELEAWAMAIGRLALKAAAMSWPRFPAPNRPAMNAAAKMQPR